MYVVETPYAMKSAIPRSQTVNYVYYNIMYIGNGIGNMYKRANRQ